MEERREPLAGLGERPVVEVAPHLEDADDAIEPASERADTAADPVLQLAHLTGHAVGLGRCLASVVELWISQDRIGGFLPQTGVRHDDLGSLGPGPNPIELTGDFALVRLTVRRERSRQVDLADPLHRLVEVGLGQRHEDAARCDEADADTAAAPLRDREHRRRPACFPPAA